MKFTEKYNLPEAVNSADTRKVVTLKEPREDRKYIAENPNQLFLTVYQVDGALLKSQNPGDKKCDYAIYTSNDDLFLIELKGSDYSQALDQIKKTLDCLLTPDLDNLHSVNGRVVLSKTKVPATLETKEKKMMLLLGKLGGTLKKKSREFREVI